jgi:hypothetical protein
MAAFGTYCCPAQLVAGIGERNNAVPITRIVNLILSSSVLFVSCR